MHVRHDEAGGGDVGDRLQALAAVTAAAAAAAAASSLNCAPPPIFLCSRSGKEKEEEQQPLQPWGCISSSGMTASEYGWCQLVRS